MNEKRRTKKGDKVLNKFSDFINYFIIYAKENDTTKLRSARLKISINNYSFIILDFMILIAVISFIFNFNLLTLIFFEISLFYAYLLVCTLEIVPTILSDFKFSDEIDDDNKKTLNKVYYYYLRDYYLIINVNDLRFYVNSDFIVSVKPSNIPA
jgi:hypothetical protein